MNRTGYRIGTCSWNYDSWVPLVYSEVQPRDQEKETIAGMVASLMGTMFAVLVEAAYIIHPREEALLRTEAFQCAVAHAEVQGLRDFASGRRRVPPTVDEMENLAE